jgi:DNA phosphorothioation-dependent restriction protein DptG
MKFILLLLVCGGGWYWYTNNNQITEQDVRNFYQQEQAWLDAGNSKEMCDAVDEHFSARITQKNLGGQVITGDKTKYCADMEQLFATLKNLNDKMGGGVVFNQDLNLDKIEISSDKKIATVAIRSELRMGTDSLLLMKITG